MADEQEIERYRKHYADKSRSELLHEQKRWVPHSAMAIAATQLLAEMDAAEESKRHTESLVVAIQANRLSRRAIWIAVVALAVAGFEALLQWHDSATSKSSKTVPAPLPPLSNLQSTGSVASIIIVTSTPPTGLKP
jgi:hypothetical protein